MIFNSNRTVFLFSFLFFSALALFFWRSGVFPLDTAAVYNPLSENIAAGRGFLIGGEFDSRYPPLYPLFLALVRLAAAGLHLPYSFAYFFTVIFLNSWTCVWFFKISNIWLSERESTFAVALWIAYPPFLVLSVTQFAWNATGLVLLFLLPFIHFFFKSVLSRPSITEYLAAGVLLALSSLVWSGTLALPALIVFFWITRNLIRKEPIAVLPLLTFIIIFVALLSLWAFYVYINTGHWSISSQTFRSMVHGLTFPNDTTMERFEIVRDARREDFFSGGGFGYLLQFYFYHLIRNPSDVAGFFFTKSIFTWTHILSSRYSVFISILQIPIIAFALFGLSVTARKSVDLAFAIASILIYFTIISLFSLPSIRYVLPATPLVICLASRGILTSLSFFFTLLRKLLNQ